MNLNNWFLAGIEGNINSFIKVAELYFSKKSRLVIAVTAARVEASPHADVSILDVNTWGSGTVYSKLHSLVGSNIVKAYYKNNNESVSVYVSANTDYARIGLVPLLTVNTTFSIGIAEEIDSSATQIVY